MRNSLPRRTRFVLGAAALLFPAIPALAQFPDEVPDRFRLRLGGIFASFHTETLLSVEGVGGTTIDLTGLGLTPDHKNTFRGDGYWNFLGRSYLDFGFVDYNLSGSRSITKDLVFNGLVYKAGAQVSAETDNRYIYAAYRYGIIKNPAVHLGLSLGISYYTSSAKLSASAGVQRPDGTIVVGGASSEGKLNLPIPLLGLEAEFRIVRQLTLGARVRAIGATIDPYSGSWVEAVADVNWYLSRNFGLGGAYEYHKIHIEKDDAGKLFRFDQRYDGPRVYIVVTF